METFVKISYDIEKNDELRGIRAEGGTNEHVNHVI